MDSTTNDTSYKIILKIADSTEEKIEKLTLDLIGESDTVEKLKLDATNKLSSTEDLFEKDTTNQFEIESLDVGSIKKIKIGHDHDDRGILIESVTIHKNETNFKFTINKWLDATKSKTYIEIESDNPIQTSKKSNTKIEEVKKTSLVETNSDKKSISKQNSKSSTLTKKDSIEKKSLDLTNTLDETHLNESHITKSDKNSTRSESSSSSSSSPSSSDESDDKLDQKSARSSLHSPKLRKKSIISTTETNKSKTSLRSKESSSSLSLTKSPLPPPTPKRDNSRQNLTIEKQISRLSKKSTQSINKSKASLRSKSSHHSISPKRNESKSNQDEKINKSKISLRSNKSNLSTKNSPSPQPKETLNESKKSINKIEKKPSLSDRSDSKLSSTNKNESHTTTSRNSPEENNKKLSLLSIRSKKHSITSFSSSAKSEFSPTRSLTISRQLKNNEDTTKQTTSRSSRSSISSSCSTKTPSSKLQNKFIQTARSSSRSTSRSSSASSKTSSMHKSITLPTPNKTTNSRSSSRHSESTLQLLSPKKVEPKKQEPTQANHKRRPSLRSSRSSSASSSNSSSRRQSKRSSSSSYHSDKISNQISIPSLQKSTSTIRSSITESEILLSQSYFEDADRVVQDILLRSEESEKKKKTNNLNDSAAVNSQSFTIKNKGSKTSNLNSVKFVSRSQNTKTDYTNSDSFARFARMEKRMNYKPNVNTELQEESTHIELRRIKDSLLKQTCKIMCPKRKEHMPFVFNDLTPYADTRHVEYLLNSPLNNQPIGYYNRYTALTIVEPWVAHRMEHTVGPLFAKSIRTSSLPRPQFISDKIKDRPAKNQIEGSTIAPALPKVILKKPKGMNGPFYYDQIEIIRKELEKNFNSKTKFEEDRNRTINDYYRMNLDQSVDSEKTWDTFRAYLENTPGSKQALKDLINKTKQTDSTTTVEEKK